MEVGGEGVVCDATCDATWTGWLPRGHVGSRHIGHVTSLPSLEAKQALAIPTYCFLVLHLAKNSEHFQDNIDNCLSRWMRVLSFFLWLLAAIKLRLARTSTATRAELTLDTLFARDIARP